MLNITMDSNYDANTTEMEIIISKMPFHICCLYALPEFGISWLAISRIVRDSKLLMTPNSIAKVLCKLASVTLPIYERTGIVKRLNFKLLATQHRTWHIIKLSEKMSDDPVNAWIIPSTVRQALQNSENLRFEESEVEVVQVGDLIYMSIQITPETSEVLFVTTKPGEPIALVTSVYSDLLKACVQGLGYNRYEDANVSGRSVCRLLEISNTHNHEHVDIVTDLPVCNIIPITQRSWVDQD